MNLWLNGSVKVNKGKCRVNGARVKLKLSIINFDLTLSIQSPLSEAEVKLSAGVLDWLSLSTRYGFVDNARYICFLI